jgi:hypothetical protein
MIEPAYSADQVIFTSIPSFMGEGYRIVAAGASVKPNERAEITQRCPSHNGLSNSSPGAIGLLSFRLTTGRFCIGYSCYAGTEHTARGGQRVYTRLAIIDHATFRQFGFNPLPIHAILANVVGPSPSLKTSDRLDPLLLTTSYSSSDVAEISCTAKMISSLIKRILESRQVIAAGYMDQKNVLGWTIGLLPYSMREYLGVSIGLNYAPARKFQLTFLDRDDGQTKRLIRGQNIDWLEPADSTTMDHPSPFDPWLACIEKNWQNGKLNRLKQVGPLLDLANPEQELSRLTELFDQIERIEKLESVDETIIQNIQSKYAGLKPSNPAEAFLLDQLHAAITQHTSTSI